MAEPRPIPIAIVGPTGYTGLFLIEWLARHPHVELTYLASRREEPTDITDEFPRLLGVVAPERAVCRPIDPQAIAAEAELAFLALPHKAAMAVAPQLLDAGVRVVDLSADYRLADPKRYAAAYGLEHADPEHLRHAVYGLPELWRDRIAGSAFVANPGCYPTAAALAIAPLLARSLVKTHAITINAASGVTGAGRAAKRALHFPEQNEAFGAYGEIGAHRHQPEIEQSLTRVAGRDVPVLFVPHLLPIDQGILETIYLEPADGEVTTDDLLEALADAYEDEPFVRVRAHLPNVKAVRDTNFCDVTARAIPADQTGREPRVVVFSAIDNMVKGAAGQALQNMNLMFDLDETAGLL